MGTINIPELHVNPPEITMAPLIDIVFLLLVFFMVTTVFPDKGILIEKPGSEQATRLTDNKMVVHLDKNGVIYIKGNRVTLDDLKRLVKAEIAHKSDIAIILNVDKRTLTEKLINVVDAAKKSGANQIGIATDEVVFKG